MSTKAERAIIDKYPDSDPCSCSTCKSYCRRPCWPTPTEAKALVASGYGPRLMIDRWEPDDDIPNGAKLLCPANPGSELDHAPFNPVAGCVMQVKGLCTLHDKGLKPLEGRASHHSNSASDTAHQDIAKLWDTEEGRAIVTEYMEQHGIDEISQDHDSDDLFALLSIFNGLAN